MMHQRPAGSHVQHGRPIYSIQASVQITTSLPCHFGRATLVHRMSIRPKLAPGLCFRHFCDSHGNKVKALHRLVLFK